MKYLIDGYDKQVGSLARQYKALREGDEFRIYDIDFCNIDGKDFCETSSYIMKNGEIVLNEIADDGDRRRMRFTTDFDGSLEWCDCYVNFQSFPFILGTWGDITAAQSKIDGILERIEAAKSAGKKIYLGNMYSEEYDDVIRNYGGCINKLITKKDLEELLPYRGGEFSAGFTPNVNITMITGTNSASGKFSSMLKAKRFYEGKGEKVALICSEETYPFLDCSDGSIFGFCRNFSDLTTDEDLIYLQGLVGKIMSEYRPDRIIFATQAGIGTGGINANYQPTYSGKKIKGIWDIMIERAFGLHSVIIAGNWNCIQEIDRQIRYFNIKGAFIDAVYISPCTFGEDIRTFTDDDGHYWHSYSLGDVEQLVPLCNGLSLRYPNVRICCDYAGITDIVTRFKESEQFDRAVASHFACDLISSTMYMLSAERQEYSLNAVENTLKSYENELSDDEMFRKAKAAILEAVGVVTDYKISAADSEQNTEETSETPEQ